MTVGNVQKLFNQLIMGINIGLFDKLFGRSSEEGRLIERSDDGSIEVRVTNQKRESVMSQSFFDGSPPLTAEDRARLHQEQKSREESKRHTKRMNDHLNRNRPPHERR